MNAMEDDNNAEEAAAGHATQNPPLPDPSNPPMHYDLILIFPIRGE
jgi:hypothetical protein